MVNSVFRSTRTSVFETMSRLAAEHGAINLGQGFPEGIEAAEVIEAAGRALRDGPHQYPPTLGLPALRQAVAAANRRFWNTATVKDGRRSAAAGRRGLAAAGR